MARTRAKASSNGAATAPAPELPEGCVWKGNPILAPFLVPVSSLHEDAANANTHPERSIAALAGSYARFGQQKPLVADADGVVRDGNGQLRAACERLGWTHIAVVPSDLTGSELAAYGVAANRTARHAELDQERLAVILGALRDEGTPTEGLGWEQGEVEAIVAAAGAARDGAPEFVADDDGSVLDGVPGGDAPPPVSHVRMVSLFLDTDTQPRFLEMVEALGRHFGTDNLTDTTMKAVEHAHRDLCG